MVIPEKDIRKISVFILIALLAILAFIIIRPVVLSVISGLLLSYIFFPLYKIIRKKIKNTSISAGLVCLIVLLIVVIPLWFLVPVTIQQVLNLSRYSQGLEIHSIVVRFLPTASEQLVSQVSLALESAITKISSLILSSLVDLLVNLGVIALHLVLVAFVFYFALRDSDKLIEFISGLSPLTKSQEKVITQQFGTITKSLVYGQIIIGILQGIFAGLGFLVFGIPNALVLTIFAVILGILPVIGPGLIYIPVTLYLLASGKATLAIVYLLYNVIVISYMDNILRSYLVSRKTTLSQAVVLVGMIGGLLVFGVLGLILGPLILTYFIHFLRAYKEKTLSSLFSSD